MREIVLHKWVHYYLNGSSASKSYAAHKQSENAVILVYSVSFGVLEGHILHQVIGSVL